MNIYYHGNGTTTNNPLLLFLTVVDCDIAFVAVGQLSLAGYRQMAQRIFPTRFFPLTVNRRQLAEAGKKVSSGYMCGN